MRNLVRIALASLMAVTGAAVAGPTASAEEPVDVYTTPGIHRVNGRTWLTACEPYSVTTRCHTQIQATVVSFVNGAFTVRTGWAFNNLTYLPSPRSVWKGNPLGKTGRWTDRSGRAWRTECDTAATGRGACRSFAMAKVIARTPSGYQWRTQWVFNSMTRFTSGTPHTPAPDPGVTFADPALTTCVRDTLGLGAEEKLTDKAAATVEQLACPEMQITSLKGIDRLPNLSVLDLSWNEIDDLTPLSGNTSLQMLLVGGNRVRDLTPLGTLPELNALDVSDNPVTTLGPLAGLPGLVALAAADTGITTIAPLASLDLYQLEVGYNPGLDLATIGRHTQLNYLGVAGTGIRDLTRLATLTQLEWLDLADNRLTALAHLPTGLLGLNLASNELSDVAGLEHASALTWLSLDGNPLTSAAPLGSLRHLDTLSLAGSALADLTPVGRLTRLTVLDISGVPATDVRPLASLVRLDVLFAVDTAITDFSPLDALVDNGLTIITRYEEEEATGRLAANAEALGLTRTRWLPASVSPISHS